MTDYDVYWNGEEWRRSSSDLKAIPFSNDTVDFQFYTRKLQDKSEDIDGSSLVSYTDLPWYDAKGNKVASGSGNIFHKGDDYGPYLYFTGVPRTTGNNTLKVTVKHKGSIWTDYGVTFHVLVKRMTAITFVNDTERWTKYIEQSATSVTDYTTAVKTGYTLDGWYTGKDGGGTKVLTSSGAPVRNTAYADSSGRWTSLLPTLTLYAYFTVKSYNISTQFVNCTGSLSKSSGVSYTEQVTLSWTAPSDRAGLRTAFSGAGFDGLKGSSWVNLKSTSVDRGSMDFRMSSDGSLDWLLQYSQIRARVRYEFQAPVRLYSSNGSMGSVGFSLSSLGDNKELYVDTTSGNNSVKIYAVPLNGYEFVRWSDGSTTAIRTITVTSAKELTATFQAKQYTITVKASTGGSITTPSGGTIKGGVGTIAPIVATPSAGYILTEWSIPSTATVRIADPHSASTQITIGTSNDTITAKFAQAQTSIVLDANAPDGTDGSGTIQANATSMSVSTAPKREQSTMWNLTGYYLNAGRSVKIASKYSSTWKLEKDVVYGGVAYTDSNGKWMLGEGTETFYAEWLGKELTVTLNPNGGTVSPTSKKVNYGGYYGDLPEPVNSDESLHFEGWYTQQTGGDRVDSSTLVTATSNHTLYAHWTPGYIVTFDANGGHTDEVRRTVIPGRTWGNLPTAAWTGHELLGWYTAQTGGVKIRSYDTVSITQNTTLWAHWKVYEHTFTLTYNANGGSGAPATQTAVDSEDFHDFAVSASIPTRAGHEFVGWARSSSSAFPEFLPSGTVRVEWNGTSASLTLYAVWMELQPSEGGDIDHVTIFKADATGKAPGTAHIDVSSRLTQRSVIRETESYGMTATFTIVNGETSTDNLLASTCVWSSGTGALDVGMFVRIRHGSETGMSWGWFFITSMSVSDDLISITCGDYIQLLRANGADYYRNHYDPSSIIPENRHVFWNNDEGYLYVSKPEGVSLIGGSAADVKIMVPSSVSYGKVDQSIQSGWKRAIWTHIPLRNAIPDIPDDKAVAITSITVKVGYSSNLSVAAYFGESISESERIDGGSIGSGASGATYRTYTFANPIYVGRDTSITVKVSQLSGVGAACGSASGFTTKYYSDSYSKDTVTLSNTSLDITLGILVYDNASGEAILGYPGRWKVTRVASGATVDSSMADYVMDSVGGSAVMRGWIEYMDQSSGIPISEVVRNICGAADCSVALGSMNRSIQMFRCAGSYFHDYLLALADMTEASGSYAGRNHALCASQSAWASLMVGLRRRSTDGHSMTLYYGGDQSPESGAVRVMSFDPKKTMQYRPCKAVSKGLDNDGNPILVCVKDPVVKLGSSAVTMESTDTSSVQAALNAYNTIIRNRSDEWEGEVVLDGIIPSVMSRMGVYIGGTVVRIYDSRYGMAGLKAKVREAVYDYQNLKTTLYLNNAPEDYSNGITDTSKMAYASGTLSLAVSGEDMYLRQYVFLDVTGQLTVDPAASHTLTIEVSGGTPATTQQVTAEVIAYPELHICTLVGYFAPGTAYSMDRYAVTSVKVDNTVISIGQYRRPDKRDEQYLIVNVQCSI